ncbi:uncharacterized protein LOC129338585 [Eublepharis macularius]|uniref:Uncharacterized protein LOC129338585 n=1 Tax=Eublepharis macularius TaxID=481883 RepID=A0AA97K491_EUBMA|nr:uncharacterized protein LOC129338585 [Eublepharis macularius]
MPESVAYPSNPYAQLMQQGMGDNPQEKGHLQLKLPELGMKGNFLESLGFHLPHKLASQGQVPEECASAHPFSNGEKASSPQTCSYEERKNQKKVKLANGTRASPGSVPSFSPMLELPGMSYGHSVSRLDLQTSCSLNMPQFRQTADNLRAAHSAPYVTICAPPRHGEDLLDLSPSSHQLLGCCLQSSHDFTAIGDSSRVTVLYVELIRELEQQKAELRRLLAAREEAAVQREKRIQELELENRELKGLLWNLEEQNDFLSSRNGAGGTVPSQMPLGTGHNPLDVNESNIQFLKRLVGMLENLAASQISGLHSPASHEDQIHTPVSIPKMNLGWSTENPATSTLSPWLNAEDQSESPVVLSDGSCLWNTVQDTLSDGTPVWASPVEENGIVKLELVPNSRVYITHHQLEDLSQLSTDKPELMTRRLLDYFFSRETLARSSATGQRIAHNNMTMEKPIPLPVAVLNAVKEYVTKTCGRGCNFNAVINSKCGTSRRAVKKMIVSNHQNRLNGAATNKYFQEPLKG